MSQDERYMQMALKLAARGTGNVEPNPAVGCVIVKSNQVIGKGFHEKFGGPHAEINALEDCTSLGVKPEGATMYVTLEPCCHIGKTGPCTEAIIAAKPARVVIAATDPTDHVAGKGINQLRDAGIEVAVGVCQTEAELLNAPHFKFARTGRPWVLLKWAQSIDGKLARQNPGQDPEWISNEKSRKDVHKIRRSSQAILVGVNTVIADNPQLTPRPPKGKEPLRVVLDTNLRIPLDCNLLKSASKPPVLIMTTEQAAKNNQEKVQSIQSKGAQLVYVPVYDNRCDLDAVLRELGTRGVQQLLVEGGPTVIASFLARKLADAVRIYIAPKLLASSGTADITAALANLNNIDLDHTEIQTLDQDTCLTAVIKKKCD